MIDVCVVGSANLDLVATADRLPGPGETVLGVDFREHPGGKGLNQAVAAARAGGRVAFVGTVGRDDAGTQLRAVLGAESIDVEALDDVDGTPTGRALIVVDRRGENSIVVVPGANAATVAPHVAAARVLLTQLEVPLPAVAAAVGAARRAGTTTILNPAPASAGGLDPALLSAVDIIVPNEHEVQLLGGVEHLRALGVGAVIVTRGAHGVDVSSAGGRWHQPAFPVDVVDTTAAGDAFCGALAARLAAGHELRAAVCWAAAAGALATTVAGAVPSL
ncbi:MAG: ribokinase, partial [Acidimicrobiia bacterium]|nr:ribokinase [Acidimicrobiia bacterium]